MSENGVSRANNLFSTPLELGMRALVLLDALGSRAIDLQRLIYLDYLLVHSGDVDGGPESLHPAVPHRGGEVLVKRDLLQRALRLMASRELIAIVPSGSGIAYRATAIARDFLGYIESSYHRALSTRAEWVARTFVPLSDDELRDFMSANLGRWGGEFSQESLVREVAL